jgi:signal peptidase I
MLAAMRAVICAVMSFFVPGLGDAFLGRYRVMAAWMAAFYVVVLGSVLSIWIVPMTIAIWIASIIGAFRAARAASRAGVRSHWVGMALTIVLYVGLGLVIRGAAVQRFTFPSSSMAPTLEVGDLALIDKLSLHVRGVARGDVIVFRHPCAPDVDYIKRVIALAGETVEVRCNAVYVDGRPLAARLVQGMGCSYDDENEMTGAWSERPCSAYAETAGTHVYRVYHDPERPERDAHPSSTGDAHDFPRIEGPAVPPSCAASGESYPSVVTSQLAGTVVETKAGAGPCELQRHYVVPAGHVFTLGDNRSNSNDSRYWGAVPLENIKGRAFGIVLTEGRSGTSFARFGSVD